MNIYDVVDQVVSSRNIELIAALYKVGLTTRTDGLRIREQIEEQVSYINPYKGETFTSFRDLLAHWQHMESPLHSLMSSNGYLVIQDDMKLPWSFDDFLRLFRYTKFRGLRILPSLRLDNESKTSFDSYDLYEPRFALLRRGDNEIELRFYAKEFYHNGRGDGVAVIDAFTTATTRLVTNYSNYNTLLQYISFKTGDTFMRGPSHEGRVVVNSFCNPDQPLGEYSLHFGPIVWEEALKQCEEDDTGLIVLEHLTDDGELPITKRQFENEQQPDLELSYRVYFRKNNIRDIYNCEISESIRPYRSANLSIEDSQRAFYGTLTREEEYSYFDLISYWDIFWGIISTQSLRFEDEQLQGLDYGCYDTGVAELCLVCAEQVNSGAEFQVLRVQEDNNLYFHTISLR